MSCFPQRRYLFGLLFVAQTFVKRTTIVAKEEHYSAKGEIHGQVTQYGFLFTLKFASVLMNSLLFGKKEQRFMKI